VKTYLTIAVSSAVLTFTFAAKAAQKDYVASAHAEVGVGLGNFGLAGLAAASADVWLSEKVGLGLHLGILGQVQVFDRSGWALFAGPEIAFRSYVDKSAFWLIAGSAGYAHNVVSTPIPCDPRDTSRLCLISSGTSTARSDRAYGSALLGYVHDGSLFKPGVGFRADAIGWPSSGDAKPQFVGTLNFILGFKTW
jgi:hypothetical protein